MYNLIEIATTTGGVARGMTPKDSWDAALMTLHQAMASSIANENVSKIVCEIIGDDGLIYKSDAWEREAT